jgi:hypothetical protein
MPHALNRADVQAFTTQNTMKVRASIPGNPW